MENKNEVIKMKEEIKNKMIKRQDLLLSLNFNINSIGFKYWLMALEIYENENCSIEKIYKIIANTCNSTRNRVERAMRHCSEKAKDTIQNKYNYYNKITTKTILVLICNIKNTEIIDKQKEELYKYFY